MTTFIAFVCGQAGVYDEGKLSPKNVSMSFAFPDPAILQPPEGGL